MPVKVTRSEMIRRMERQPKTLFSVAGQSRTRKTTTAKEVLALERAGLTRAQADALTYIGLCGGEASWVEMSFAHINTRSIAILEQRELVVRAIERELGPWGVSGGYVFLTKSGIKLLKNAIEAANSERVTAAVESGRAVNISAKRNK